MTDEDREELVRLCKLVVKADFGCGCCTSADSGADDDGRYLLRKIKELLNNVD